MTALSGMVAPKWEPRFRRAWSVLFWFCSCLIWRQIVAPRNALERCEALLSQLAGDGASPKPSSTAKVMLPYANRFQDLNATSLETALSPSMKQSNQP